MRSICLLGTPVLLALASTTLAAQSGDMTNGIVSATFTLNGGDVQLTRLRNLRENLSVDLAPAGPHFVAELEPDPSSPHGSPSIACS